MPLPWEKLSSAKPAKELRGKSFVESLMIFITSAFQQEEQRFYSRHKLMQGSNYVNDN